MALIWCLLTDTMITVEGSNWLPQHVLVFFYRVKLEFGVLLLQLSGGTALSDAADAFNWIAV